MEQIIDLSATVCNRDSDGKPQDFMIEMMTRAGGTLTLYIQPQFDGNGDVIGLTTPDSQDDYLILSGIIDHIDDEDLSDKIIAVMGALT